MATQTGRRFEVQPNRRSEVSGVRSRNEVFNLLQIYGHSVAVDLKFKPTVDLKCHNATPHTKLTSNLWPLRVAVDFELFCEAG